jgi:hypothetical protein
MMESTSHLAGLGSALPFQMRLTQTKTVLPLSNERGSQVKDQGRRQCCHNKHKNVPIGLHVMYLYFPDTPRTVREYCTLGLNHQVPFLTISILFNKNNLSLLMNLEEVLPCLFWVLYASCLDLQWMYFFVLRRLVELHLLSSYRSVMWYFQMSYHTVNRW